MSRASLSDWWGAAAAAAAAAAAVVAIVVVHGGGTRGKSSPIMFCALVSLGATCPARPCYMHDRLRMLSVCLPERGLVLEHGVTPH